MKITKNIEGFTLLEMLTTVTIIGVLAAIALPSYRDYVLKARAAEITVLLRAMKGEFYIGYNEENDFPMEVNGSKAYTASRIKKEKPRVKLSEHIIGYSGSNTIDKYWYDNNPLSGRNKNMAWIAVSVNKVLFPECGKGKYCAIHLGIKRSDRTGQLHEFCGRWSNSKTWGKFPLEALPEYCRSTCVRCDMRKIR